MELTTKKKEKTVYESEFKPKAKILKRRTGIPITKLRSRRAGNYFVSTPGTLAISSTGIEWYTLGDNEIAEFLREVIGRGRSALEERSK